MKPKLIPTPPPAAFNPDEIAARAEQQKLVQQGLLAQRGGYGALTKTSATGLSGVRTSTTPTSAPSGPPASSRPARLDRFAANQRFISAYLASNPSMKSLKRTIEGAALAANNPNSLIPLERLGLGQLGLTRRR